jgi:Ras-related protein Rab-1A
MNSIGVDFKLKNIELDNKKIKLQIWDTAGQERFRTITTSYYKGAHAIVIVFDITDKDSFDHVKVWMQDIDKFAKQGVMRILVGNKCDLEHQRAVTKDEGNEMALKYGIKYIETSAKDTVNIEELFVDTAKNLMAKQQSAKTGNNNIGQNSFGIDLTNTGSNSSEDNKGSIQGSGCC